MKLLSMMIASTVFVSALAQAQLQSGIKLGDPAYGGTGCPAGTASVTLSPSQDALSVLFDQFVAEAGGIYGRRVDRKSCNLSIPVQIPQGYSVAVIQTDYRGFNLVPAMGAMNKIESEYFWAGIRGPKYSQIYRGPINDNFTLSNGILAESLVWTSCGARITLRVNTNIMTQTNARNDQSMMTVDSADITSGLIYHLQWRQCQ